MGDNEDYTGGAVPADAETAAANEAAPADESAGAAQDDAPVSDGE